MLRVILTQYGQSWNLPKDKILAVIPQSIIGQALETEPDIATLDISHPDVIPAAMDIITDYLHGKEPDQAVPGLEPSGRYLNIPWLRYYSEPMYDRIMSDHGYYNTRNPLFLDHFLVDAAKEGNIDMMSYLLQKGANPVKTVLPKYSQISYSFSEPLRIAASAGHLDIIKLLLADPRIATLSDLSNVLRETLGLAVNNGHVDVARYIFTLTKVDPQYLNEHLIPLAVEGDDIDMVKLLLAQGPILYQENKGLTAAIREDRLGIIDLYLQDLGWEPHLFYYLATAAESSSPETVEKFLAADPSQFDNDILKDAIRHDRPEIVKLLLADPRVNPATIEDRDESLYEFMHENPEGATVRLMQADGRLPARFFVPGEINQV